MLQKLPVTMSHQRVLMLPQTVSTAAQLYENSDLNDDALCSRHSGDNYATEKPSKIVKS